MLEKIVTKKWGKGENYNEPADIWMPHIDMIQYNIYSCSVL
jgi:hypothetical protein